jgi:hypothetical protein
MGKTYLVRTEIYYKITVSDDAKNKYYTEDGAAHAALEDIHNYDLYWHNDENLTLELKMLDNNIDKVEYYGRDYNTVSIVDGSCFRSLTEQQNSQ